MPTQYRQISASLSALSIDIIWFVDIVSGTTETSDTTIIIILLINNSTSSGIPSLGKLATYSSCIEQPTYVLSNCSVILFLTDDDDSLTVSPVTVLRSLTRSLTKQLNY